MLGPVDLTEYLPGLNWVIVGAESGSDRRPFDIGWAENVFTQCERARVPFFCKQGSTYASGQQAGIPDWLWNIKQFPRFSGV